MGKFIAGIFLALAISSSGSAQGTFTYRFDWHGFSNFFHASFVISQDDYNGTFTSQLFRDSISITNPSGQVFNAADGYTFAGGSLSPRWELTIQIVDSTRDTEVLASGGYMPDVPYLTAGFFHEIPLSTGPAWLEEGYWQITQQIPEPSATALCILGATVFLVFCRRRT